MTRMAVAVLDLRSADLVLRRGRFRRMLFGLPRLVLTRLAIPFRLEGTLPNVRPKPDIRAMTERITSGLMQKGIDRLLGKKKDKNKKDVQDWIKKGMEQLFGK